MGLEFQYMTKIEPAEISCPGCHTKQTVMLYESLNVSVNPEAKKDLIDGKIHLFICNNCNAEIVIEKDLLYHDMSQHFIAYFIPRKSVFNDDYIKNQITPGGQLDYKVPDFIKDNPEFEYFKNFHIVLSMDELIRYVIFRDRIAQVNSRPEESESP